MQKKFIVSVSLFVLISVQNNLIAQKNNEKKLIEFGWDYPNISFLEANITNMEKTPFDGVVFSFDFDIYNAFDTTHYDVSKFQYDDLSKIQWKKFSDNFLFMRGAGHTGAHWLDNKSWEKISENLKNISKALAISKTKGIGFDPEFYYPDSTLNPWIYKAAWYHNFSYKEVGKYVRKRGKQFIENLQTYKPDVKILCFWLLDLVYMQSLNHPVAETGMALYPFFIQGMLDGKNKESEIIDGNESSYYYQKPENFVTAGEFLREKGKIFIPKSLQPQFDKVSLAHAIYFDWIYAKLPAYEKGFNKQTKESWLEDNLYSAFKTSDKYIWFYDERINWWKGKVDSGVAQIIKKVRNKIKVQQNNKANQITGTSLLLNFKEKEHQNYQGFYYNYSKNKNTLRIKFLNNNIKSLQIYENSKLIYSNNNPAVNFTINLNNIYNRKDNLIAIAKDRNGVANVAYIN